MTDYPVYIETEEEDTLGGCVFPAFAFLFIVVAVIIAYFYVTGHNGNY